VLDLNYISFSNPNPTHLPTDQTLRQALITSFLSVFDMQIITLCMRIWREVEISLDTGPHAFDRAPEDEVYHPQL